MKKIILLFIFGLLFFGLPNKSLGATSTTVFQESASATSTLTVVTKVINDGNGVLHSGDFTISVAGIHVSRPVFSGSANGVTISLDATNYFADAMTVPAGYTKELSPECIGVLTKDQNKRCIITFDDVGKSNVAITPPSDPSNGDSLYCSSLHTVVNVDELVTYDANGGKGTDYTFISSDHFKVATTTAKSITGSYDSPGTYTIAVKNTGETAVCGTIVMSANYVTVSTNLPGMPTTGGGSGNGPITYGLIYVSLFALLELSLYIVRRSKWIYYLHPNNQ